MHWSHVLSGMLSHEFAQKPPQVTAGAAGMARVPSDEGCFEKDTKSKKARSRSDQNLVLWSLKCMYVYMEYIYRDVTSLALSLSL